MEVKDNPSSEDVKTQETSQEVKPEVGAIPYDRFKEVNEERKKLEKELEKLKKQIEENETLKLKEKEKFKELYEKTLKEKEEIENVKKQYEFQNKVNRIIREFDFDIPEPYLKLISFTENDEELKVQIQKIKEQFENDLKRLKKTSIGAPTNPAPEGEVSKTPPQLKDFKSIEAWKQAYEDWRKKIGIE